MNLPPAAPDGPAGFDAVPDPWVRVIHPLSDLLFDVAATWNDACAGRWGNAVVRLCADRLTDPEIARQELNKIGASTMLVLHPAPGAPVEPVAEAVVEPATAITFHASVATVTSALDLFSRVHCGQWNHLWPATDTVDLSSLRVRWSRPYDTSVPHEQRSFPDHPRAYVGIAEAPLPARIAYHAFKALGGGTAGAPTFSLPEGPVSIETSQSAQAPEVSAAHAARIMARPRPSTIFYDPQASSTF